MTLKGPRVIVDAVISDQEKILLVKRKTAPFMRSWVLPGGHVDLGETVEAVVIREVKEETNRDVGRIQLLGVYSDPARDPRYPTVSIAFLCTPNNTDIRLNHEASAWKFCGKSDLPENIGFDHKKMIADAFKMLESNTT